MSRQLAVKCDECGTTKGETNHWFVVMIDSEAGIIIRNHDPQYDSGIVTPDVLHDLCGRKCVIQFVSKSMGDALC